jgi:hypothetical protein
LQRRYWSQSYPKSFNWTTRALEKDAKVIHVLSSTVSDNRVAARLDGLSNRALDVADHIKSSGFFITLARRSLLRSAVLFAQAVGPGISDSANFA